MPLWGFCVIFAIVETGNLHYGYRVENMVCGIGSLVSDYG